MTADFMSSEESGYENGEAVNVVKELPWRSLAVEEFFDSLDSQLKDEKSPQAKRQTKRRVKGSTSTRKVPSKMPKWARCVTD